jgi:hypothetical protein
MCTCHGSYPVLWPDSTKAWGITKMLLTANHGSAAPTGWSLAWSPPPPPCWASRVSGEIISCYRKPQRSCRYNQSGVLHPTQVTAQYTQLGSCHGPAAGRQRRGWGQRRGAGRGRAHPAGHAPQLGAAGRDSKLKKKKTRNSDLLPRTVCT